MYSYLCLDASLYIYGLSPVQHISISQRFVYIMRKEYFLLRPEIGALPQTQVSPTDYHQVRLGLSSSSESTSIELYSPFESCPIFESY